VELLHAASRTALAITDPTMVVAANDRRGTDASDMTASFEWEWATAVQTVELVVRARIWSSRSSTSSGSADWRAQPKT
jgi:hypothetical protein